MRAFIAIELPPEVRNALGSLEAELKTSGADVKWVKPENIHLTLKFLGERDEKKIKETMRILDEVCAEKNSFSASVSSIGAFPNLDAPRVIWVGIGNGSAQIKEIACELEERISKLGIPKEDREFSTHITLGRTHSGLKRKELTEKIKAIEINYSSRKDLKFEVNKITLLKSTLTPGGPIYEALKTANLKSA